VVIDGLSEPVRAAVAMPEFETVKLDGETARCERWVTDQA
jgi:hypothetical protein